MAAAEQLDGMISRVCFPVAESQSASSEKSQTDTEGVRKPRCILSHRWVWSYVETAKQYREFY
jgi:hypothetical protein